MNIIDTELQKFAIEMNAPLLAWKEFGTEMNYFTNKDYYRFDSLPDCHVKVNVENIIEYRDTLRSNYKRKFLSDSQLQEKGILIEEKVFGMDDVGQFYEGYIKVMKRTKQKLEIYSIQFFYELALCKNLTIHLLTVSDNKEQISALVSIDLNAVNFLLVSKELQEYKNPLYNWLMQAVIKKAIECKKPLLKMGQTSYYSKQSIGAQLIPLHIFLKHRSKIWQKLLGIIGPILFPSPSIKDLNVFKKFDPSTPKKYHLRKV